MTMAEIKEPTRPDRRTLSVDDLLRINLPKEQWRVRIEGVQPPARERIAKYLTGLDKAFEEGAGLLLMGEPGVGKTAIAALVAKEAFARHRSVYFTTFWELREAIREGELFSESDGVSILGRCKTVDVLVLDNLRAEDGDAKWYLDARAIEEIVRFRRGKKLPTCVTTCLNNQDLAKSLPGFADAVTGAMIPLMVRGTNLRTKRSEELAAALLGPAPKGK